MNLEAASEESGEEEDRVLGGEFEFAIADMDEEQTSDETPKEPEYAEADDYEYELDKLSVDYHSFTNSEYMKVCLLYTSPSPRD